MDILASFLEAIQPIIYCFIPVLLVFMLSFAWLLIVRSPSRMTQAQTIFGAVGGVLVTIMFVIIDMTATGLSRLSFDPTNIRLILPAVIFGSGFGFVVLLFIDVFLRRGATAFVVLFIVSVSLISAYFLITASDLRALISLSTIAFLFGNIIYIISNFEVFYRMLYFVDKTAKPPSDESRWRLD